MNAGTVFATTARAAGLAVRFEEIARARRTGAVTGFWGVASASVFGSAGVSGRENGAVAICWCTLLHAAGLAVVRIVAATAAATADKVHALEAGVAVHADGARSALGDFTRGFDTHPLLAGIAGAIAARCVVGFVFVDA